MQTRIFKLIRPSITDLPFSEAQALISEIQDDRLRKKAPPKAKRAAKKTGSKMKEKITKLTPEQQDRLLEELKAMRGK